MKRAITSELEINDVDYVLPIQRPLLLSMVITRGASKYESNIGVFTQM